MCCSRYTASMTPIPLRIRKLSAHATAPVYQSDHAAGMDLHAALADALVIEPGEIVRVPCGFAMSLPAGFEAQVRPRSGLASKHGVTVANTPGTIDADYRGQVMVALINHGREPFTVEPKMRIAQMVVAPVMHCEIEEVDELDETVRGAGGFGSTGQ